MFSIWNPVADEVVAGLRETAGNGGRETAGNGRLTAEGAGVISIAR
jgi:hypothetical protein